MMKFTKPIRKATLEDLNEIYEMESESFGLDAYSKRLLISQIKYNDFYILQLDNKIIGYTTLTVRKFWNSARISNFLIHKNYRGKGYSNELMNYIKESYKNLKITLEVRIDNAIAINAYKKAGFEIIGNIKNYYSDGCDAYKMLLNN